MITRTRTARWVVAPAGIAVAADHHPGGAPSTIGNKFDPETGKPIPKFDPETGKLARPESARVALEWYRAGTEPKDYTPDQIILDPEEMDLFDAEL